jgi:hypothetical protein
VLSLRSSLRTNLVCLTFAFGVDGVIVKFEEAPRGIREDTVQQDFWNCEMTNTLNMQIVGNHKGRILYLSADWQGATADAHIWNASAVKFIINRQRHYLVAGDSDYIISETCITPYCVAEGDPSKRLLNRKHSGLHTLCTECIFWPWKHRWRCLKMLRTRYAWADDNVLQKSGTLSSGPEACVRSTSSSMMGRDWV